LPPLQEHGVGPRHELNAGIKLLFSR
jgi:hypothetical protein